MSLYRDRTAISRMLRELADTIDMGEADPAIEELVITMPSMVDRHLDGARKSTDIKLRLYGVHVYEVS